METIRGTAAGLIAAALVTGLWGMIFDRIGFSSWFLGSWCGFLLGGAVGVGTALPYRISDVRSAEGAQPLPLVAFVLGGIAAFLGDLLVARLRAPGLVVDGDAILLFAQARNLYDWLIALLAAGGAAAVCHRMISTGRR